MCVRCGTGRIAWCTDPMRHGESDEPVSPGEPPVSTKADLHAKIFTFLHANASYVRSEDIHGWRGLREHEQSCGLDYVKCSYTDDDWTDGYNSYGGGGSQRYGIALKTTCKCGQLTDVPQRYSGTHVDLIRGITEEEVPEQS